MADQVQCPNCGGYKVNTEKKEPITETRKVHISLGKWTFQGIAAILLWRLIGACAFIYLLNISQVIALLVSVFIIALPILILGIASPSAIREAQRGTLHQTKVITVGTKYHFYCQLCGYRWLWDTGTPSPKVALG